MENKPLVSVIMGIYNCANTLEEAAQCIIEQTYTNWELIMCDDCSTDNTYEIALKIAEKDSRIKVLKNKKNLTLAPTLNRCLEVANGKYIARMDGDDICDSIRLEKELVFLENNLDFSIVSVWMNMYDETGIFRTIKYKEKPQKEDFIFTSQFCHAGCMVRADAIKSVSGYSENTTEKRVEDYDLWVRMYANGNIGYNIQEPLYSMRDDRNAISRRTLENRKNEARIMRKVVKLFHLPKWKYIYSLIPLIKYFIPTTMTKILHRNKK